MASNEAIDPRALSLFTGMGGMDVGARIAGIPVALGVDIEQSALDVLASYAPCPTAQLDLGDGPPDELAERANLDGRPLVVFGGPPCTGFSHAGFWLDGKRNGLDPAVSLLARFGTIVIRLQPEAWVLENVPGLTFKTFRSQFEHFKTMVSADYSVHAQILNAADFGVPQRRNRLFVVGLRGHGREFKFPEPFVPRERHRTAAWAFRGIPSTENPVEPDERLEGRYAHLLPEVPEGDNYLYFTERRGHHEPQFKWRSRYWSFLKKLHPDEPSNTLPATRVTNNGPFHWENRHLRIREMARIQGFPDSAALRPTEDHRRFVGNAVPPLLAGAVFSRLADTLGGPGGTSASCPLESMRAPTASSRAISEAIQAALTSEER